MTIRGATLRVLFCAIPVLLSGQPAAAQSPTSQAQEQTEPSAARKGFIIGIGGGAALHRADDVALTRDRLGRLTISSVTANNLAIVTDFKIGYAPSDRLLIHYTNKVAWSRADDYDYVGLTGAGVTYMTKQSTPSFFVTGSAGGGVGGTIIETARSEAGFAFSAGGGYEFTRHLSVGGDAMFVRLGNSNNHTVLMATFNYLYY